MNVYIHAGTCIDPPLQDVASNSLIKFRCEVAVVCNHRDMVVVCNHRDNCDDIGDHNNNDDNHNNDNELTTMIITTTATMHFVTTPPFRDNIPAFFSALATVTRHVVQLLYTKPNASQ